MERIENDLLKLQFLREEHHQRYQYVASFAKGVVVDCACGIGYSAPIILSNPAVVSYTGLDVDREAIAYAQEHNTTDSRFEYGSILALPFDDCSVDTFISLETLEHLEQPELAIAEVKRVLKPNGIFICSVPTKDYENFCVSLYGPNPYHIQAFSLEALKTLLQAQFSHVDIAVIAQELVSIVHTFQDQKMPPAVFNAKNKNVMNGSFIAISSNVDAIYNKNTLFTGMSRIEYDQELVSPLRQSLEFAERLAEQRWQLLLEAEKRINEVTYYKEQAERISEERMQAFRDTEEMVRSRDQALSEAERIIQMLKEQLESVSKQNSNQ
ncbi:TPA: methyltransferase domain-containing protein [Serratia marcescens]|jgi:2-polyprenyl-3-methyl-5-hydroxy-6-metoxy-1,4-benzoquinol methylase|uniref:methyltransferase domain-containing protein n=1 Tax=Serratia TaxID=613 RepID=UPI0004514898|nr:MULTISPECIES: methyltransferase domain-containing protein [Serratia]MDU7692536.1 methyltransferase domain-containing protein [Escherichia coli]AVN52178.1 class I SAM-dependent methyltransferase [Serratia marcescens]AWC69376.1 class I SAM-dependent methyltransferase [Serratia marcescens]AWC76191.1 class I SAM-dependent methyltransferase [Serratia marcescens]AWC91785.1 class I SAM-dependent methyltransferase [Serratia marcescens]